MTLRATYTIDALFGRLKETKIVFILLLLLLFIIEQSKKLNQKYVQSIIMMLRLVPRYFVQLTYTIIIIRTSYFIAPHGDSRVTHK